MDSAQCLAIIRECLTFRQSSVLCRSQLAESQWVGHCRNALPNDTLVYFEVFVAYSTMIIGIESIVEAIALVRGETKGALIDNFIISLVCSSFSNRSAFRDQIIQALRGNKLVCSSFFYWISLYSPGFQKDCPPLSIGGLS